MDLIELEKIDTKTLVKNYILISKVNSWDCHTCKCRSYNLRQCYDKINDNRSYVISLYCTHKNHFNGTVRFHKDDRLPKNFHFILKPSKTVSIKEAIYIQTNRY